MVRTDTSHDIDSEGTLRDILADLVSTQAEPSTIQPQSTSPPPQADSSWILPPYSPLPPRPPSTTCRLPPSPMPRTSSASRPAQQQIAASTSQPVSSAAEAASQSSSFTTPSRSIFSSGPPTASVSANTAQASLSAAGLHSSSRPLAALSANSAGSSRRNTSRSCETPPAPTPLRRGTLQLSDKDVDDPSSTQSPLHETPHRSTAMALSKLLADGDDTPLPVSKDTSYFRAPASPKWHGDASTLSGHLLQRGLVDGRHSDITIHAFGSSYRLHRLLLDRAPFFSSALSGSWAESSASEITLHPEEMDSNITKAAFELALKRIYGCYLPADEEQEAIGLFATSCWLDMSNVVESSLDILLRQMEPSKLGSLIRLVTSNYYGKAGDRILASAKAMLCREGWEMPYGYWDNIPSEIIREVVGGDAFFVPGEWERWYLALRLLNRRLKASAIQGGLLSPNGRCLLPKPITLGFFAVRFDATYRRDLMVAGRGSADGDEAWIGLYTSSEIAPLLVLLDEGIHYVHLRFEHLQYIRRQKDRFGVPVLPEKVISDALWMSMELRQRVVNAHESEMELGISREAEQQEEDAHSVGKIASTSRKGKQPESHVQRDLEIDSGSWDGNGKPRKFWIPTRDSSSIMGGATDAYLASTTASASGGGAWNMHMSRLSASLEPSDVQWATDFTVAGGGDGSPRTSNSHEHERSHYPRYSRYPPFRFSAEFPNPRTLKEKKRVYSQTVWYAGSMWNLYIQRVNTSKNPQLGIYLHRAKDKDPSDDPFALYAAATVDDRIGHLEREMLLRRHTHRNHQSWRSSNATVIAGAEVDDDMGGGSADPPDIPTEPESPASRRVVDGGGGKRPTANLARAQKTSQTPDSTFPFSTTAAASSSSRSQQHLQQLTSSSSRQRIVDSDNNDSDHDHDRDDEDDEDDENEINGASNDSDDTNDHDYNHDSDRNFLSTPAQRNQRRENTNSTNKKTNRGNKSNGFRISVSAIPPYTDARPTIRTYFKIYSPSRAGRMLSVYESAPDRFNFSQSWGWKSSQMVLDEGLGAVVGGGGNGNGSGSGSGDVGGGRGVGGGEGGGGGEDAKLRYMVVIGIV